RRELPSLRQIPCGRWGGHGEDRRYLTQANRRGLANRYESVRVQRQRLRFRPENRRLHSRRRWREWAESVFHRRTGCNASPCEWTTVRYFQRAHTCRARGRRLAPHERDIREDCVARRRSFIGLVGFKRNGHDFTAAFHQNFHARFGFLQLTFAIRAEPHTCFKQSEAFFERQVTLFQFFHDAFELLQACLEGRRRSGIR